MTIALWLNSTAEIANYLKTHGKVRAKSPDDVDPHELAIGIREEKEHADNDQIAEVIALQHLREDPHYYTKLQEAGLAKGYKLQGKMNFQGLPISIENKKGSYRHWHDPLKNEDGKTLMRADYGYIRSTKGADGEGIDVYVGPDKKSEKVFVVDQQNPKNGTYDENKVLLGYNSAKEAKRAYLQHYDDPKFFGGIHEWKINDFQDHVHKKKKLKYLDPNDRVEKAQAHHPARYQNEIFAVMDRRSLGKKHWKGKKAPRSEFADPYSEPGDLAEVPRHMLTLPGPKHVREQERRNRWIVRHSPNTMMGVQDAWG